MSKDDLGMRRACDANMTRNEATLLAINPYSATKYSIEVTEAPPARVSRIEKDTPFICFVYV